MGSWHLSCKKKDIRATGNNEPVKVKGGGIGGDKVCVFNEIFSSFDVFSIVYYWIEGSLTLGTCFVERNSLLGSYGEDSKGIFGFLNRYVGILIGFR